MLHQHITSQDRVAEFHKAFNMDAGVPFSLKAFGLRRTVIEEEMGELADAMQALSDHMHDMRDPDRESRADDIDVLFQLLGEFRKEMTDVRYVIDGTYVAFGWDGTVDTNKVHANNMEKVGPDGKAMFREDGKVLKPEGFKKIDPATLVEDDQGVILEVPDGY